MGRLSSTAWAIGLLLAAAAPQAHAAPVALLDAPRAQDVALANDEVIVGRSVPGGGVRVDAIPVAGGAPRPLLSVPGPRRSRGFVGVVASSGVVAALVLIERDDNPIHWDVYAGPPAGPLALRERVRPSLRAWVPFDLDADGDRVLVSEGRLGDLRSRAHVVSPQGSEPVPWSGTLLPPAVLAADRVAFLGSTRTGRNVTVNRVFTIARGSGAVEATIRLRGQEDVEDGDLDLAPDGRMIAAADGSILTAAPGVAQSRLPGEGFTQPRFSADGIAALQEGRFAARRPVVLDPGATPRAIGSPSTDLELLEADDRGVAWLANGCVLYAARDGEPPAEPPAGPCPRAEVFHEEGDQVLRGRRLDVVITCVAAPTSGCHGTALLGRRGTFGRGPFRLAPGTRRTVHIRLTDRGMRHVRSQRRREGVAFFGLSARVRDGRAHGTSGVLVARVR